MLRPGARAAGAVLLAALAALDLAWIVRDFDKATAVADAWWMWSGLIFRAQDGIWASSFVEPTLLVLYTVCAVTAAVSSAAGSLFVSTGVLTILLRVPTLWNLNASWVQSGVSDGLRTKVLVSAIAMLVVGAALIVLGAVGRRPVHDGTEAADGTDGAGGADGASAADGAGAADGGADSAELGDHDGDFARPRGHAPAHSTRDEPPARPTRIGGAVACALLAAAAAALAAWEIHSATEQGWALYSNHFTGDRALATLLAVPESWYGWALTLLALWAAAAALARVPHSRPLGMTVSGPLLGLGLFHLSFAAKSGLLGDLAHLSTRDQLWICTALLEVVAALGVLSALAPRNAEADLREAQSGTIRAFSSA
ncbi:hypothetical protein [Streptomyces nanshensis]|uniref:hypothetical protein n=1 Tax=Streptomyces nanshensis TaxID=518642 RepID=UPI00085CB4D2|nr:hypothetical protein [Streptomyces nanshensis]